MNKMNKKGFTLIEMLVVIAIIAVLVSIIVPVVGNSTTKAAAATNAANLRAVVAAVSIKYMENPVAFNPEGGANATTGVIWEKTAENGKLSLPTAIGGTVDAPKAKAVSIDGTAICAATDEMKITITANGVSATYNGKTIADFADIAEDGKLTPANANG